MKKENMTFFEAFELIKKGYSVCLKDKARCKFEERGIQFMSTGSIAVFTPRILEERSTSIFVSDILRNDWGIYIENEDNK